MKDKAKKIVLWIIFIAWALIALINSGNTSNEIVPILGLPEDGNFIIVWVVWPVSCSLVTVLVFSRIFAPLYLKIKGITSKAYKNVFLSMEAKTMQGGVVAKRFFLVFLLALGLTSTLLEAGVLDPNSFITPSQALDYAARGIEVRYTVLSFMGILYFILPLVSGLWAISWALEDAGLMRYSFPPADKKEFFEIEPMHYGYKDILKGYSGISAVIYYIGAFLYISKMVLGGQGNYADILGLAALIINSLAVIPAYLLYSALGTQFLKKGLKETPGITKEEFESKLKAL